MMCESGWTHDRCQLKQDHAGPHDNDSQEAIREWLEDQPGSGAYLVSANHGYPLEDMLRAYHDEGPRTDHTVRGELVGMEGLPYGTTHDMDCPGCVDTPFLASPRSETYWSS